jgi:xanthine dehydrogenase accessory factor
VLDAGAAADACARLSVTDAAIVLSHDLDLSGAALVGALRGSCGYVGALGSRHTQSARAHWLTEHGVRPDELERIHGPAGLDLGARTPVEIAIAIIAELMMIRAGSGGSSLRDRPGPVHRPQPAE